MLTLVIMGMSIKLLLLLSANYNTKESLMIKKITITVILMCILNVSLLEASSADSDLKKQCQYDIYGNGKADYYSIGKMMGIIEGLMYLTDSKDKEEFAKSANFGTISDKGCQNALKNISENGFKADYKWELTKLISKKF